MKLNKPDSDRVVKMKQALLLDGSVSRSPFPHWLDVVGNLDYNNMWRKRIEPHHIRGHDKNHPEYEDVEHQICLSRPEHDWAENGLNHPEYGRITGYEYMWLVLETLARTLPNGEFRWGEDWLWLELKIGYGKLSRLIEIINKELPTSEASPPK
jgi:hypothetical protein